MPQLGYVRAPRMWPEGDQYWEQKFAETEWWHSAVLEGYRLKAIHLDVKPGKLEGQERLQQRLRRADLCLEMRQAGLTLSEIASILHIDASTVAKAAKSAATRRDGKV